MSINIRQNASFNKDFQTGCFTISLIILIVFVGFPLLLFALKASIVIAIPIMIIVILIFAVAFFGRIVRVIKERW